MSLSSAPRCCGQLMRELTDPDERAPGCLAWICDTCKRQTQTLPDCPGEGEFPRLTLASGKHSRDPRLFGIRRKALRWEVRIAGGRSGLWLYIGLAGTIGEAIRLRDAARQQRVRAA